jgi:hypothetical protein
MRGLAYRRQQGRRARDRAFRYLRWLCSYNPESITAELVARYAVDRAPCSCSMCGNPRRFFGEVTLQELRASYRRDEEDA